MTSLKLSAAFALLALVACGGSAPAPAVKTTRVSLLSTVPAPGATNDRWADLHFTFSAPVDWTGLVYADCTSPGCRIAKVPYRFVSTGAEVVGSPVLPPEPGQSYSLTVEPLLSNPTQPCPVPGGVCTVANIDFAWSTLPAATTVSSDVTADTTLALAGSPYYFAPGVLVRAALTIPAGVEVIGDLVAAGAGTVTAIGTPTQHIRISTAVFSAPGRLSYVDLLNAIRVSAGDVDHADIEGAPVSGLDVLRMDIAGALTDSRVVGFIVRTLAGDTERNVFLGSTVQLGGGFIAYSNSPDANPATRWTAAVTFANNYVQPFSSAAYTGLGALVTVQSSAGVVRGNTFVLAAGYLQPARETTPADLSGNWWGTADAATISSFVPPNPPANDPFAPQTWPMPTFAPVLAAADPATPAP